MKIKDGGVSEKEVGNIQLQRAIVQQYSKSDGKYFNLAFFPFITVHVYGYEFMSMRCEKKHTENSKQSTKFNDSEKFRFHGSAAAPTEK